MPEYVYALHDFLPENVDEISFNAGDRIEVLEKDDEFGDGWWQGKNLQGNVGLFPQSYTAPALPATVSAPNDLLQNGKSVLHPLDEESEPESAAHGHSSATLHAPIPKTPAVLQQNGNTHYSTIRRIPSGASGEVMKATMTDVQQAIEQLGRHDQEAAEDGDGQRSFSFASSRGDDGEIETDTDYGNSDADVDGHVAGADAGGGQSWHNNTRRRLAEKARRAVEEAEKLEAILNANTVSSERWTAPPINVELSDESDGEDYTRHSGTFKRMHPHIPEEDEGEEQEKGEPESAQASVDNANDDKSTSNAYSNNDNSVHNFSTFVAVQTSASQSTSATTTSAIPLANTEAHTTFSPRSDEEDKVKTNPFSPLNSSKRSSDTETRIPEQKRTSSPRSIGNVGVNSLDGVVRAVSPQPQSQAQDVYSLNSSGLEQSREKGQEEKKDKPPTEWTVEDVIEWLKNKGFDQDVQNKFIEQEITGDVLLELDANVLKSEIGIMAFGKRVRIANAIVELRGVLSTGSPSFHAHHGLPPGQLYQHTSPESFPGPMSYHSPSMPPHVLHGATSHSPIASQFVHGLPQAGGPGGGHERTYSTSQNSQRSMSVSGGVSMLYSQSLPGGGGAVGGAGMQQSLSMPMPIPVGTYGPGYGWGAPGPGASSPGANGVNGHGTGTGTTGAGTGTGTGTTGTGSATGSLVSRDDKEREKVGLGLVMSEEKMRRPAHLSLSPSDGALSDSVKVVNGGDEEEGGEEEDRGHMSETDATLAKKTRRRLFGRSHDSSVSRTFSRNSKDISLSATSSTQASPVVKDSFLDRDKESKPHVRPKKSTDVVKTGSERLSIFGATFSGSLGKGRKPPPRYSLDDSAEKSSLFPLPRLSSSVGRRSGRPQTPNGSPKLFKEADKEKEKDVHTLRKRTTSSPTYNPPGTTAVLVAKKSADGSPISGANGEATLVKQGQSILEQIGQPDHSGWMRKRGERYNTWRTRYFVLSGPHLYCLRSNSKTETKIKGYVNIMGYKVTVDETVDPGKYGFRIDHDAEKTHYFSSDDKTIIRDWMKAIMKATIGRDYSKPVISSCNIPTIPLTVAQAMNPAPRPPSPSVRAATQKAHRNKDLETLGVKDLNEVPNHATLVLMGLHSEGDSPEDSARLDTLFSGNDKDEEKEKADENGDDLGSVVVTPKAVKSFSAPPRPARRQSARGISGQLDAVMIEWANSHLPIQLRVTNPFEETYSALALFRLVESIKGQPASPPVPDSAFPAHPNDDKSIEGLFALFDFLVNNEVKMGSVSINDVRLQRPDKVAQIVRALRSWEERRRLLGQGGLGQPGAFMAPVSYA